MVANKIVVIGASAGGFEALKTLVGGLPPDFPLPILIVWHMAPHMNDILPQVLSKFGKLTVVKAVDIEPVLPGHIYVAPVNRHLLVENQRVRITKGPKENRFRPAIDPLFRSAAYSYGQKVIGIVLSGALDDGTAGLWSIKRRGGITIVQDPDDAEVRSMPENALRAVAIDYKLAVADMPDLLVRLSVLPGSQKTGGGETEDIQPERKIEIASEGMSPGQGIGSMSGFVPFTCPECQGVLSGMSEKGQVHYRCHNGHTYSTGSLTKLLTENVENSLWNSLRAVEETVILFNNMGDHFAEMNQPKLAATYFRKANAASNLIILLKKSIASSLQINAGNS